MKLFTNSGILKSTVVEITSPRILESPNIDYPLKRLTRLQGIPITFPLLSEDEEMDGGESVLKEEARSYYTQTKEQADLLLAEAKQKAQEIIARAEQESEALKKSVAETVRLEVIPQAQQEGLEKGLQEAKLEAQRIRQQAKAYLELAQTALMDEFHRADRELTHLCLEISQRIICTTLQLEPQALLAQVRNLTLMPQDKEGIKLHLSAKDWEWYKKIPAEDKPAYPVMVDETLKQGDVFLECAEGVFDARIQVQLAKIEQYLLEEMTHGRLDGFSPTDETL